MKNVLKGVASLSLVAMMITSVSAAGTGTGKAPGFYGEDFTVTLTVSNGQVTDVQYSCPTDDFGEDACSALAGKLKGQSGVNLDAVSDATISSNAFITAAKAAYDAAKANDVPAVTTTQGGSGGQTTTTVTTTTTKPVTTTTTTTTTKPVSGKPYTATAAGFGGDLSVTLIMENGKINGVTTDCSKETKGPAFGQNACKVLSEALVGKTEISLDNVSGATITTNAFIAAANEALNASKGIVTTTTPAVTTTTQPVTGETFSASEKGFGGDITVNLVVDGGKINGVTYDCSVETPGAAFGQNACKVLAEELVGKTEVSLDAVSGATVTSEAFEKAASAALAASKGEVTPEVTTTPAVTTTPKVEEPSPATGTLNVPMIGGILLVVALLGFFGFKKFGPKE